MDDPKLDTPEFDNPRLELLNLDDPKQKLFKEYSKLEIFPDLNQDVIVTTEDRLKLKLIDYQGKLGKKKDWTAPLSIALTIILVLVTTKFQDFILPKDTWYAFFIIVLIISIVWFLFSLKHAFSSITIQDLINDIKVKENGE